MKEPITPCIWFDDRAEEAANFYVSLFPNSGIDGITRYTDDHPFPPRLPGGTALLVRFHLDGRPFSAINGGPIFPQTEAVSFVIPVEDQAELDRLWDALIAGGGSESQCGWCKDRYGVSWQVVPAALARMQETGTAEQVGRLFQAVLPMRKLDLATLQAAFEGRE